LPDSFDRDTDLAPDLAEAIPLGSQHQRATDLGWITASPPILSVRVM
jgi:hypothetical protein